MPALVTAQEAAFKQNSTDYFERAVRSARTVLPLVLDLVGPSSVVDYGCGGGAWIKACSELGIRDLLGVDGQYVDRRTLVFPSEQFCPHDLRQPFESARRFDLAISLEVAKHIPAIASATFIDSLVRLAPVILFSAAIPYQGGVGHVNEQWPSYWSRLFDRRGYVAIDCVRKHVWNDACVDTWYRQNIVVFASIDHLESNPRLRKEYAASQGLPLDVVHPNRYLEEADPQQVDARKVPLKTALQAVRLQLKRKLRKSLHWRLQKLVSPS